MSEPPTPGLQPRVVLGAERLASQCTRTSPASLLEFGTSAPLAGEQLPSGRSS